MILVSILISDDAKARLPPVIEQNIASFKNQFASMPHRLFDRDTIRDCLRGDFGAEVLDAFDRLVPYAYKADLARYCLLHRFGGVYADLAFRFRQPLPTLPGRLTVFRDFLYGAPSDTINGLFVSPAGHKALRKAIELVCANVRQRHYGPNPLCPTGPSLFGKAVAMTCDPDELIVGESAWVRSGILWSQRRHGLFLDRALVATKRRHPDAAPPGFAGGNDYYELWKARRVYKE